MTYKLDKVAHFLAGYSILISIFLITGDVVVSFFGAFFTAIVKEVVDNFTSGTVDFWDIVATLSGALGAYFFIALFV